VAKEELKQDLAIVESTDPADRDKEVFFRQVLSLLGEMKRSGIGEIAWIMWSSFVLFSKHENYPMAAGVTRRFGGMLGKGVEEVITHSVLGVAAFFFFGFLEGLSD
jgi:hypothetical protein